MDELKMEVEKLEADAESRILSTDEIMTTRNHKAKIYEMEKFAKQDLQKKAKIRWLKDGDENSHFFHGAIKSKNS